MDTSDLYIKMCDCPEIQEQAKYEIYNYFIDVDRGLLADGYDYIRSMNNLMKEREYVWLPRQDQIQEMLKTNILDLLNKFYKFAFDDLSWMFNKDCTRKFNLMEQLWLAFYMSEKHSKIWSSKEEKWVKK